MYYKINNFPHNKNNITTQRNIFNNINRSVIHLDILCSYHKYLLRLVGIDLNYIYCETWLQLCNKSWKSSTMNKNCWSGLFRIFCYTIHLFAISASCFDPMHFTHPHPHPPHSHKFHTTTFCPNK